MFSYIYYHFRYEFLHVYDGDSLFAPELAKLTGNSSSLQVQLLLGDVRSTGRDIFINFLSDDTETRPGFIIQFDAGKRKSLPIKVSFYLYLN